MKTKLNFMYILLMLVGLACSHNIEKQENFIPPTVKNAPRLIYPRIAQENLYSGTAKIDILVNKTGTVNNVYIKKSSGYNVLDHSALDYCKNLTFNPAIRNGEPLCRVRTPSALFENQPHRFSPHPPHMPEK